MFNLKNTWYVAALVAATAVFGLRATAQPIIDESLFPAAKETLLVDVTGDGVPDRFDAFALNRSVDVVSFSIGYDGEEFFDRTTLLLPINLADSDSFIALENGSVQLSWGCFACGRYHSQSSVTVAWRDDGLRVVGFDYAVVDRIFAAVISCSVNLLNGKALVAAEDADVQNLSTSDRAFSLEALPLDYSPEVCGAINKYDDKFMEKHFGDAETR